MHTRQHEAVRRRFLHLVREHCDDDAHSDNGRWTVGLVCQIDAGNVSYQRVIRDRGVQSFRGRGRARSYVIADLLEAEVLQFIDRRFHGRVGAEVIIEDRLIRDHRVFSEQTIKGV